MARLALTVGVVALWSCGLQQAEVSLEGEEGSVSAAASANPITADVIQIGYNVLSFTAMAEREYQRGARFFLSMDDVGGAQEFKRRHPDAIVMVRVYLTARVDADLIAPRLGLSPADPGLIYTGHNEGDQIGTGVGELRERAAIDLRLAQLVRERTQGRAKYAAGTFSMGTPDFTNAEVCALIKELYAPAYNRGDLVFDMHLYSPTVEHIDRDGAAIWFERRWEFLFTDACGFDPNVRGIYSSETGLDEGGVGGFPAHDTQGYLTAFKNHYQAVYGRPFTGDYAAFVVHWVQRYKEISARPLVRNGQSYPSPYIGGAIFQLGNTSSGSGGWAGYSMEPYVAALATTFRPQHAGLAIRGQKGELPLQGGSGGGPVDPLATARVRIAAYVAGRAERGAGLGTPVDNGGGAQVHRWDELVVQDFSGGVTQNRALVADSAAGTYAVINGFYRAFLDQTASLHPVAPLHRRLGAPRGDEAWVVDHVEQPFERGTLRWSSQRGVWPVLDVPALPSGTLVRGATGPAVVQLQDALVTLLFLSPSDRASGPGTFGPRTQAAVAALQQWLGVPPTGGYDAAAVGPALRLRLQP